MAFTTFEKKFTTLKAKFIKADVKKLPENFAIQLTITDEDCGGTFYIANIDGTFSVEPYDYVDNNAAVTASSANIAKIAQGKVESLEIFGDASIVDTLAKAYASSKASTTAKAKTPAAKKAPAKKAAAKKPVAKKTETKPTSKKTGK